METEERQRVLVADLVGRSPRVNELRRQIARLADHEVNLLLQGESGTGKELVARMVHRLSVRREGPFIGVNCAAIHESLLESELFGHEVGAFTGAEHATLGFLRAADGGTILLDEIGDMSGPLQSKLLRVLEERAVVPVGGTQPIPVNIRIIAATNRDLGKAVEEGNFRADLYYRINVVRLSILPLRDRREDIPLLAAHMSERTAKLLSMPARKFSPAAMDAMLRSDWPGNVRQLGNAIQRAYVLGDGAVIETGDLTEEVHDKKLEPAGAFPTLRQVVREHVGHALEVSGGVRSRAASILAIDRKSLWRMMRRYEIA